MRRGYWIVIPGLLILGSGCGHGQREEVVTPASAPVSVEVTNGFALPVEIFVVGGGTTHRLGTVHPGMGAHFVIPPSMIGGGTLELLATATSTRQVGRSAQLLLAPGSVVDFQVANPLFNSTATIRP
ncbi:MAG TPA: hypothetical protein VGP80_07515 [Gemmatimonadales bacterium]|jgi:hypothetical protein|nr:hypothetical protein [Gemmatimonadales bacterium]